MDDPFYILQRLAEADLYGVEDLGVVEHEEMGVEDGAVLAAHLVLGPVAEDGDVRPGPLDRVHEALPLGGHRGLLEPVAGDRRLLLVHEHEGRRYGDARG